MTEEAVSPTGLHLLAYMYFSATEVLLVMLRNVTTNMLFEPHNFPNIGYILGGLSNLVSSSPVADCDVWFSSFNSSGSHIDTPGLLMTLLTTYRGNLMIQCYAMEILTKLTNRTQTPLAQQLVGAGVVGCVAEAVRMHGREVTPSCLSLLHAVLGQYSPDASPMRFSSPVGITRADYGIATTVASIQDGGILGLMHTELIIASRLRRTQELLACSNTRQAFPSRRKSTLCATVWRGCSVPSTGEDTMILTCMLLR